MTSAARVFSSAGTLGVGTGVAQGVTVLASLVISRIFEPSQIGAFGAYLGLVMLIAASPCLNFQQCILLEQKEEGVEGVVALSILVNIALIALVLPVLPALYPLLAHALPHGVAEMLVVLAPLSLAVTGVYTINQFLSLRSGAVRALANYQISRATLTAVFQVMCHAFGAMGLAIGQLAGQSIGLMGLSRRNLAVLSPAAKKLREFGTLSALAVRYKRFALFGAPQSILNAVSAGMPTVIISALFGPAEAGFFWLAFRVLSLPSQVVGESLRGALYQTMGEAHRTSRGMRDELVRGTVLCGGICALFALPVLLAGPWLFATAFGVNWRMAGVFAQIAAIAWLLQNTSIPATVAITIHQRQRFYLGLEIVGTAARLGAFALAAHGSDATHGVILYSVAGALQAIVTIVFAAVLAGTQSPTASETAAD